MRLKRILLCAAQHGVRRLSERAYLHLWFRWRFGRWPCSRNPKTFNEHILNYKLSTRGDTRLPRLADKILCKDFVASTIGADHVVPTLWHGAELPPREQRVWAKPYVIKSSHACGQIIFVRTAEDENWKEIEKKTSEWLAAPYQVGERDGEWHYGMIEPRLLVEPMLGHGGPVPADYKLYVFGARVGFITVDEDRYGKHRRYTFDRHWNALPFEAGLQRGTSKIERPANLVRMTRIAETLGRSFEFVRVDVYEADGALLVGELTFFPGGGSVLFDPPEGDAFLGSLWRPLQTDPQSVQASVA